MSQPANFMKNFKQISQIIWNGNQGLYIVHESSVRREVVCLPLILGIITILPNKKLILWCDSGYVEKDLLKQKDMARVYKGNPVQAMIANHNLVETYQKNLSPFILFTLHTWFDVRKKLNV